VTTTYEALRSLKTAETVAKLRDKTVAELFA
jgi:ribosomal protein S5